MNTAHLIANSKSGQGKGSTLAEEAQSVCQPLGIELKTYAIHEASKAVANAIEDGGVVIAAGGDGTVRSVAQAAHGKPVRIAVVPCGTFNYFARTHKIPEDHLEAFRLSLTGETRPVRLGQVNGEVFLINASLGFYVKAIKERENATGRFGRNRIVATLATAITMLREHLALKVDLVTKGQVVTVKTPMIFIGNNALQLRNLALDVARCMKADLLAVVVLKRVSKLETLRILFRGVLKTLEKEERMESFCVDELTIHTRKAYHTVALDGELFEMKAPLKVIAMPEILNLVLPPREPN